MHALRRAAGLLTLAMLAMPAGDALAAELLVMPYACTVADGQPMLTPAPEQSHRIIGHREQRTFTACSSANPGMCRTWTVHRFDLDCDGARVPWVSVVAAAAGPRSQRAWVEGDRLAVRMPPSWSFEPDDPCARGPAFADRFGFGRMRRYCADRRAATPPPVVEMPPGFAPMLGIDGYFVRALPTPSASPPAPPPAVGAPAPHKPLRVEPPVHALPDTAAPPADPPAAKVAPPAPPAPKVAAKPPPKAAAPAPAAGDPVVPKIINRPEASPREPPAPADAALRGLLLRTPGLDSGGKAGVVAMPGPHASSSHSPFEPFDVLTRIGEHAVDNEGMVQLPDDLRLPFPSLLPKLAKNGPVPITLIRGGRVVQASLPVSRRDNQLLREFRGEKLPYFIHGPLVFAPARFDAVALYARFKPLLYASQSPLITRRFDRVQFPGEELVVVTSPMFAHKIAKGYDDPVGQVVQEVNGIKIRNLCHLVETLRDCRDDYLRIRFAENHTEVLVFRRADMDKVTAEILEDNGIAPTRRGSEDMLAVWKQPATDVGK